MKKIILLSILFVFLSMLIILPMKYHGQYWAGFIWCKKSVLHACPHEVAHYVDEKMGFPSKSGEFLKASKSIGLTMWSAPDEVYAELYTIAQGKEENMPEALREFYNWELADKLMEKYDG